MNTDFNFGPYNTSDIRISVYGMAIKNKQGKWVSYDKTTKTLMDVDILNFEIDSSKVFYKIPKPITAIDHGDIILHNGKPVFVDCIRPDKKIEIINPYEGTAEIILLTKSPFGFTFASQIVSLMDNLPEATEDNPFGKFLPYLLMGKDGDNTSLLLAMMMNGQTDIDPMMMLALCGKGNMSAYFLMQMMNKNKEPKNKAHAIYGPGIEDRFE